MPCRRPELPCGAWAPFWQVLMLPGCGIAGRRAQCPVSHKCFGKSILGGSWPEESVWGRELAVSQAALRCCLVSRWAQGAQEAAALPMTKDLSMHFSLLPCLPRTRVKPPMGRCSWFGDVQSVPVLGLLVCGITPNAGILFSSADLGHLEGAKCGVFCPALSRRSPQARGAQWQVALLATFFAFLGGFFELSFGIFPHLAHFT